MIHNTFNTFSITINNIHLRIFETINFRFIYIFFANFLRFRHLFILRCRNFSRNLFVIQSKWRFVFFLRISHFSFSNRRSFFLINFFLHLHFCEWHFHESINNAKFSIFVRTTSTESNQSKICLIRLNKKNAKKLFNAKTRIENQKQIQTKSQKIIETKRKKSYNNETNWKIYLSTLQKQYEI